MSDTQSLLELLALVTCVIVFEIWERRRPGHAIDRRRAWRVDLLGLVVVIVVGTFWKRALIAGFDSVRLHETMAVFGALQRLPSVLKVSLGLVLADFALYWVHRAMHGSPLLWRTHVFHHSIEDLYWLSGARTSALHLLLFALPQVLLAYYVLGLSAIEASVAFSIGVVVNLWVHTNVRADLGPLGWLLITPDYHRIHHGASQRSARNLGFVFTVWDRVFGTYEDPRRVRETGPLGLAEREASLPRMVIGV